MQDTNSEQDVNGADTEDAIVSYPRHYSPAIWIYLIFILEFVLFSSLHDRSGHPALGFLIVPGLLAIPVVYSVLYKHRSRMIADQDGIQWRGVWHGWRSVRWDEIVDYRTTKSPRRIQAPRESFCEIVTKRHVVQFATDWHGADAIQKVICRRADSAKVSHWERLGTRRIDSWPRTFSYWNPSRNRNYALMVFGGLLLVALVSVLGIGGLKHWEPFVDPKQMLPAYFALYAVIVGCLLLPALPISSLTRYWRHRRERFTVTRDALEYTNGATRETIHVPWSEISDYFSVLHKGRLLYTLVLSGSEEKQITWSPMLQDSDLLLAIVQQYAPRPANAKAETTPWRVLSVADKMGGSDPATWRGGAVGIGDRIFSYRGLANRIGLAFLTSLVVCFAVFAVSQFSERHSGAWIGALLSLLCLVPTLQLWREFLFDRIEIDDMGITQYTFLRKKRLYWYMIDDYRTYGKWGRRLQIVGREGTRFIIYSTITGYHELKREIERHAPPPKTGWRKTTESTVENDSNTASSSQTASPATEQVMILHR